MVLFQTAWQQTHRIKQNLCHVHYWKTSFLCKWCCKLHGLGSSFQHIPQLLSSCVTISKLPFISVLVSLEIKQNSNISPSSDDQMIQELRALNTRRSQEMELVDQLLEKTFYNSSLIYQTEKRYIFNLFLISWILILMILSYHKRNARLFASTLSGLPLLALPLPPLFRDFSECHLHTMLPHTISLPFSPGFATSATSIFTNQLLKINSGQASHLQSESQDSCQASCFVPRGLWIWLLPCVWMFFRLLKAPPQKKCREHLKW